MKEDANAHLLFQVPRGCVRHPPRPVSNAPPSFHFDSNDEAFVQLIRSHRPAVTSPSTSSSWGSHPRNHRRSPPWGAAAAKSTDARRTAGAGGIRHQSRQAPLGSRARQSTPGVSFHGQQNRVQPGICPNLDFSDQVHTRRPKRTNKKELLQ